MRDIFNNVKVATLWDPIDLGTGNTPKVSEIIDLQGFNSCLIHLAFGSIADTDATFTVLVEDGDNSALSDNAAVADAYLNGTELGATPLFSNDNTGFKIGYTGPKRYLRLTLTPAANTGAILTSAVAVLSNPSIAPQSTQAV
jgi:hypothetical protein